MVTCDSYQLPYSVVLKPNFRAHVVDGFNPMDNTSSIGISFPGKNTHTHTYENKLKQPTTIYSGLDVDKLTADQLKWNLIERCSTCVHIYIILYIHTRIHIGFYYNHHMLVISSTKQWDPPGSRQGWDLIAWTPRFRRRCSGIPRTEFMKNPGKHTNKTIENGHL